MLKTHFKIIFRNLQKNKGFTFINLAGLSISLAAVMLIAVYLRYELSYDRYLPTSDRTYRIWYNDTRAGQGDKTFGLPSGFGEALKKELPEVEDYVHINGNWPQELNYNNKTFNVTSLNAGNQFFNLFPYQFLKGNAATALKEPGSIVLTETTARKFFGEEDPINKVLVAVFNDATLKVTGIIKDIPANTHFWTEAICAFNQPLMTGFGPPYMMVQYHYVLLKNESDVTGLEQKLSEVYKKFGLRNSENTRLELQLVTSIHLHSHTSEELGTNSDIRYIYIFTCAAALLLLIAGINYVNLSTARSFRKAREVGVRKVLGAKRKYLIVQFLSETTLFFLISTIVAVLISVIIYPWFAQVLKMDSAALSLFDFRMLTVSFITILAFGLLSGLYPAFYLSRQSPAFVIKGAVHTGTFNSGLRKALVLFQFTVSMFLILVTIVIFSQLRYIQNKNLGFDKEQLISIPLLSLDRKNDQAFKNALSSYSGIKEVAAAGWTPGDEPGAHRNAMQDKKDSTRFIPIDVIRGVSTNFIPAMGIKLIAGRNFSDKFGADVGRVPGPEDANFEERGDFENRRSIILNETAVKFLELKDPVGQHLTRPVRGIIIGVVKDFNVFSLRETVRPTFLEAYSHVFGAVFIRIKPGNVRNTLAHIEKTMKEFYPDRAFEPFFVDDKLQKSYESEKRLGTLCSALSFIGIFIACLGLLGLAAFMAEQRTKEIGIRKVLGASVLNIVSMLNSDFLKPVAIASLIAFPAGWWAMNKWLQDFAYRIEIQWWMFALAGGLAVLIALVTVSFRSLKAATANPVNSLRSE